jgi:hypothetical protein
MRFKVSRTSIWDDEEKPCEEAVWESYLRVDTRTVDSPEKLTFKNDREDWYKIGKNHRVENGNIKRDFNDEGWFIYIHSLEELNAFVKKYGRIVYVKGWAYDGMEIEIYDSYRE